MEPAEQIDRVASAVQKLNTKDARSLIAIGGPPASGKSTLAAQVHKWLEDRGTPCGLVPMDGFHLDNQTLKELGLLDRKGAPETFDIDGFKSLIERLGRQSDVPIPLFDRALDCVVPGAGSVKAEHRHVIVEGNYLFLDAPKWCDFSKFWSFSVFIAPPLDVLEGRLIQRWLDYGLDATSAKKRARKNDIPNAKLVLGQSNTSAINLMLG